MTRSQDPLLMGIVVYMLYAHRQVNRELVRVMVRDKC